MKTLIGINTLSTIDSQVYSNHCQFWFRLAKQFPEDQFALFTPARASIDRMRNTSAKVALENNYDYLMFIDDDIFVPFDAYKKLREANYDVAAGHVIIRGYPFNSMIFKVEDNKLIFYKDLEGKEGILDCDAVGFSCCLIKVALLKKMTVPFFITGTFHTEDVYFCMKARDEVKDIKVCTRLDVECGHLGYPPIYTASNRNIYQDLEKPVSEESSGRKDRSKDYYNLCLARFTDVES
jgi:hypothetical protein